jgi:hypothetical protein
MKVIVPIPVFGRFPLLKLTIQRLYEKNKVHRVILIGHEPEAMKIANETGCDFINMPNNPLGAKWNAGFQAAQNYDHDAVLFAGSSDWISDDYLTLCEKHIDQHAMIGKFGCHFADVRNSKVRLVYWPGYTDAYRKNETIGIGRVLSKSLLRKINYKPFTDDKNNSMDYMMQQQVRLNYGKIKILHQNDGVLLSISTDLWVNKHDFEDHWSNRLPSEKMQPYPFLNQFPEIANV